MKDLKQTFQKVAWFIDLNDQMSIEKTNNIERIKKTSN